MLLYRFAYAEPGVTESTITIGMSSPLSGPNGAYGLEMHEAISALIAKTNEEGGIYGRAIELITIDDGYEPERAVANTEKLLNEKKVFALIGYYGSSSTTAAMKVFSVAKAPLVGAISGADTLRTPVERYMFNARASYADETTAIVNQLVSIGLTKIAVFYQNDGFGKSGLNGVSQALKKHNMQPVVIGVVERNSLDVAAAVATISAAKPQAVIMVTLYKPTAAFVKQMKALGVYTQFTTLSPVGADLLAKELGTDARGIAISQVMPYPWDDTLPIVKEYQRVMKKQNKNYKPSYYGLEGFINARILIEGLKKAGKQPDREKLVDALDSGNLDIGGYIVKYSSDTHNGSKFVELTVLGNSGHLLH
ncbi:ABC transporter substrate-binding protein [Collimonas pratensis]|nr:ABC transporter substrate-binding protein [Collimonas pratensis]